MNVLLYCIMRVNVSRHPLKQADQKKTVFNKINKKLNSYKTVTI